MVEQISYVPRADVVVLMLIVSSGVVIAVVAVPVLEAYAKEVYVSTGIVAMETAIVQLTIGIPIIKVLEKRFG